ncbi:hypothetical protein OS493_026784 [Desmophyllum pertusum]|uniref:EGF-like domain-containing protein n=1 Tax=Desmophyllum pertusum TaxID=174260 RepID=A0A9W9ZMF0_9CNID|nr:hypothetical protein OS493_026784 [Desmophyllum pertusum]
MTDINECWDETDRCSVNARCTNTDGSYTCSCSSGFQGDGMSCRDLDECADGAHDCHRKAVCTNTRGSYRCSCSKGYHGNGKQCKGKQSHIDSFTLTDTDINHDDYTLYLINSNSN